MIICAQCGALGEEHQRFCSDCGARLEPAVATTTATPNPYNPLPPAPTPLQPMGYQQAGYVPQVIPNSSQAVISLIAGIVTWILPFIPFIPALVAVIFGHNARREIRQSGGRLSGDGLALIGMVLGYLYLALAVIGICFVAFFFALAVSSS